MARDAAAFGKIRLTPLTEGVTPSRWEAATRVVQATPAVSASPRDHLPDDVLINPKIVVSQAVDSTRSKSDSQIVDRTQRGPLPRFRPHPIGLLSASALRIEAGCVAIPERPGAASRQTRLAARRVSRDHLSAGCKFCDAPCSRTWNRTPVSTSFKSRLRPGLACSTTNFRSASTTRPSAPRRRKRPESSAVLAAKQQCLNLRPLPHGHGSLRPGRAADMTGYSKGDALSARKGCRLRSSCQRLRTQPRRRRGRYAA